MLGHDRATAISAIIPACFLGLAERADLGFAFGDAHIFRWPQGEGTHRRRQPTFAVIAVAVAHHRRRAAHFDFDLAATTTAFVGFAHLHSPLMP